MTKLERLQVAKSYFPDATPELNYTNELELVLAVMLSAQTTDKAVNKITDTLFNLFRTADDYLEADLEEIKEIIKPIGLTKAKANNIIKICKFYKNDFNYRLPNDRKKLMEMPGVGQKTANVVLAILFDMPYMAVDTHVLRTCKRLKIIPEHRNELYAEQTLERLLKGENINSYHQSLIYFGRYHCTAKNPNCTNCKLQTECRYYKNNYN
ncbi:endonuclease III [Mollicutes bacterium LVI A0078]|nr:endonuclease III [Mollicutes bacterium LVI A0075]WOO91055.1 endonuclease III [Mollicutes bacterium LVI A0078]